RAKIHEEALMLVEELKMKGCFVALSSNNECQLVEMLRGVERLDLVLCFDGSSHKKGRPHLETLRKRLGVEPEEAVFVGDSDYDLEVYAREGVRVLRTSGLFSSSERRRIAELVECSSSELNRT
ncbi:MAG: HAD family hydrolase, partial [Fervidicoccaceae archaeon]